MKTTHILGLLALILILGSFTPERNPVHKGYDIGDTAADFSLKNVNGKRVSLSDFKNAKGFLIIFTCNTCPYAVAYEDRIIALDAKYKSKGIPVIAINPNNPAVKPGDSFNAMKTRAAEKGFAFPYLFDEGQRVYPKYGATRTPHAYLLEKTANGNVVRYIGAIDDNYRDAAKVEEKFVENAIDALLAGDEIKVKKTRAIGCSIKV